MFFILLGYSHAMFLASLSSNTDSLGSSPIIFDNVFLNLGSHYNATTGIYTVPLDGIYEFYSQIESLEDSDNDWQFHIYVDGGIATLTRHDASGSASNENVSLSSTVLLKL